MDQYCPECRSSNVTIRGFSESLEVVYMCLDEQCFDRRRAKGMVSRRKFTGNAPGRPKKVGTVSFQEKKSRRGRPRTYHGDRASTSSERVKKHRDRKRSDSG